jgi:hypothetical protein
MTLWPRTRILCGRCRCGAAPSAFSGSWPTAPFRGCVSAACGAWLVTITTLFTLQPQLKPTPQPTPPNPKPNQIAPVVDASSSQSRTDVLGIAMSAVLLLTGLQWLSLKARPVEAVAQEAVAVSYVDTKAKLPEAAVKEIEW